MAEPLLIAKNTRTELLLLPALANRHGLITGATGTGKSVTLQTLAQHFSRIGVPVFMADVKGDLSGLAKPGQLTPKLQDRVAKLGLPEPAFAGCPTTFWDVFGEFGHPVRATVSDLGPLMLGRLLNLNEIQEGVLNLAFKIADDNGLLLLDLKDLRALLGYVGEHAKEFTVDYGNISAASIGAIQRGLLVLEQQGAESFLGEPMLNLDDMMQTDANGHGVINILAADKLMNSPKLYSTFLLWMLSELFERLPEVGDREKPKFVFFFDEAHLLFNEAPKSLLQKIEQVVRLIRSKGVGVYFVTQNPLDIPDTVLGQLGNRVQHALRAFTPRDQKAVQTAAETMRPNPRLDIAAAISELGVGEALISFLDEHGRPGITERALIVPPLSQIGPITPEERRAFMAQSIVAGVYEQVIDRESAYELLTGRVASPPPPPAQPNPPVAAAPAPAPAAPAPSATPPLPPPSPAPAQPAPTSYGMTRNLPPPNHQQPAPPPAEPGAGSALINGLKNLLFGRTGPRGGIHDGVVQSMAKSAARSIGSQLAREVTRGILGSILGGKR